MARETLKAWSCLKTGEVGVSFGEAGVTVLIPVAEAKRFGLALNRAIWDAEVQVLQARKAAKHEAR